MKKTLNLRSIAAQTVEQVVEQGQSLSQILPAMQLKVAEKDRALLQALCFGVLRTLPQLEWFVQQLMSRPMTGKQRTVHYLILVGLYQLLYTRIPPHAALAETVEGAVAIKRHAFKGVINGVLRQFQRQQDALLAAAEKDESHYLHPKWLLQRLKKAWPTQWQAIVDANNQSPPMWLRVNRQYHTREEWLKLLEDSGLTGQACQKYPDAVLLDTPVPVQRLPGFDKGWVTVQDASAQGCVDLLDPQDGEFILDLCAAPGGKTTHILERAPKAKVMAVDVDTQRIKRIHENLERLNMQAEVKQGDGRHPQQWCEGAKFDRILLDAPCSATGVIRRHPDIKWLRRDRDIPELVTLQKEIIDAIWPYLKSGGTLLYATCSILPDENSEQIRTFLSHHADASLVETGDEKMPGRQNLPLVDGGDGFFYAKLIKR
ncbi:16S rRNA (cytosine(967)-C(5))-methyltransferase RsmB [Citrobacter sp. JGM124]|uniref:16S rRNA (cytosine(967)-C(5))-methyltransferase RsmB n=1 Tax=Citrobacter sp. JGM124 TaxID=2799789 RepID=UPI001BA6B4F9|nr:16S rRNA (cytosine(967)-C(5))-methyltransferase RsmB [Citrobacter sp. JGM124]MBS0850083.1 16S rRNA (cytosine(967)-C(5))-methyltransferase RsmB [Citrobacter sp. JGM124]